MPAAPFMLYLSETVKAEQEILTLLKALPRGRKQEFIRRTVLLGYGRLAADAPDLWATVNELLAGPTDLSVDDGDGQT